MERKIEEKIIWINSNYKYSEVDNIPNIADQAAGALEGVPVIGELAGAARPFIKQGKGLIHMTQGGVHDAQKINNKFGKLKIK